ncbi:hypothetical protein [Paraburkholderia sp. Cpub6]|uniref:hypothetical protein n=1 Tax=Paraburkholderia sp. Cpub6 TaxID=2723094 RepID=UPI00180A4D90|nr:hypothetical protein [Paraburkholderia sp. Cpub6]MBB5458185.1 homospermidine synthase [Paraburkholderia sp. Cpub6]
MGVSVMHFVLTMHIEQRAFPPGNHRLGPQRGCARGHSPDLRDAALAHRLNIKAIQVAERDFQVAKRRKARNEFVDTWVRRRVRGRGHAAGGTRMGYA